MEHLTQKMPGIPFLLTGDDSLSALQQCTISKHQVKARWQHSDLLSNLHYSLDRSAINHAWLHVSAHQGTKHPKKKLSKNAILNKKMDKLASTIMHTFSASTADRFQDRMASLRVQGFTITGNVKRALYLHLTRTCLEQYLESKHIIGKNTY